MDPHKEYDHVGIKNPMPEKKEEMNSLASIIMKNSQSNHHVNTYINNSNQLSLISDKGSIINPQIILRQNDEIINKEKSKLFNSISHIYCPNNPFYYRHEESDENALSGQFGGCHSISKGNMNPNKVNEGMKFGTLQGPIESNSCMCKSLCIGKIPNSEIIRQASVSPSVMDSVENEAILSHKF